MLRELKQHLTSEWPILAYADATCFPLSDADLAMVSWSLFEKEETRKRLKICPHSCCLHVTLVLCGTIELSLRIWEGGNPEWIINPRLRWRDSWSDLLYAKTLLTAGDFLTLPLIDHLRRGRPENHSPSGPLDDDQIPLFTSDFDVFIGGVTNWSNSC